MGSIVAERNDATLATIFSLRGGTNLYLPSDEKRIEDAISKVRKLAGRVNEFFAPVERGKVFSRVNGTPKEAFDYHRAHSIPRGYREANATRIYFGKFDKTIVVPDYVMEKLDGWILQESHNITTETRGDFVIELTGPTEILVIDFIPRPAFSRSLIRPGGTRLVARDEKGTMSTHHLRELNPEIIYVLGIDTNPKYEIPKPENSIPVPLSFYADSLSANTV